MEGPPARVALLCYLALDIRHCYRRCAAPKRGVKQAGTQEPPMPAEKFDFPNAHGQTLAALLDRPDGPVRAVALFAHCFTCGKDNKAARHIAEGLKLHGIAVLRFDFTGLGASEGEFANTTFRRMSTIWSPPPTTCEDARRARHPDRPQPRRRGGARRRASHCGGACRCDDRRAVRPGPRDRLVQGSGRQDRLTRRDVEVTLAGRHFKVRRAFSTILPEANAD